MKSDSLAAKLCSKRFEFLSPLSPFLFLSSVARGAPFVPCTAWVNQFGGLIRPFPCSRWFEGNAAATDTPARSQVPSFRIRLFRLLRCSLLGAAQPAPSFRPDVPSELSCRVPCALRDKHVGRQRATRFHLPGRSVMSSVTSRLFQKDRCFNLFPALFIFPKPFHDITPPLPHSSTHRLQVDFFRTVIIADKYHSAFAKRW